MPGDGDKRRARTHGRDQRRSDPRGIPVYQEPELTPAPQDPPKPEDVDADYNTIAPPIRAQLDATHVKLAEITSWMHKLEPLRDGNRLDRIEKTIGDIASATNRHQSMLDDMLVPQLDRWRAMTDELHGQVPRLIASIEQITILVGNIEQRIRAVEITVAMMVKRVDDDSKDYEKWFAVAESERRALQADVRDLKAIERDRTVTHQALAKLERKKSRNAGALVGGGAAGLVAIVERIYHHFF